MGTKFSCSDSDLNGYTARYSKDRIGEELSPQGRFWQTYLDEVANLDRDMLDEYHKTIDQLLVFVREDFYFYSSLILALTAYLGCLVFCGGDNLR